MGADQPLRCKVEGDELVIRIGISTLAFAFKESPLNCPFNEKAEDWLPLWQVTNEQEFAHDVARAINDEAEDGSTPLHLFLDKLMQAAADDGSLGIDEVKTSKPRNPDDRGNSEE